MAFRLARTFRTEAAGTSLGGRIAVTMDRECEWIGQESLHGRSKSQRPTALLPRGASLSRQAGQVGRAGMVGKARHRPDTGRHVRRGG